MRLFIRLIWAFLPCIGLAQSLPQLPQKPLVVMNLAAHPDDEDGQTLAYYRHAKKAVAYSLIFTRGEGGQNEIGPELYEDLGALRTAETERAARILGTKVYFLNYDDFGFSKFAKEAFEKWGGRDAVTARLVYFVRKLKPDVMFTNHDTLTVGASRQHGQHQAVGIAAMDAFKLAADPTYHPEQLKEAGLTLWQPKRLFLRIWLAQGSIDVKVPVGDLDATQKKSYQEMAMTALREHATQGMGMFANRARPTFTAFQLMQSATSAALDPTDLIGNLSLNPRQPDLSYFADAGYLPQLAIGTLSSDTQIAVAGQRVFITMPHALSSRLKLWFDGKPLTFYKEGKDRFSFHIPHEATPTYPKARYQYHRFENGSPITYAIFNKNKVESVGYLPMEIAPALVIEPMGEVIRLKAGENRLQVQGKVFETRLKTLSGRLEVKSKTGISLQTVTFEAPVQVDARFSQMVTVSLPADKLTNGAYEVQVALNGGFNAAASLKQTAQVLAPAVAQNLKVGIIRSYDDTMEQAIKELGVSYKMLDSLDLAKSNFEGLHTILIDIRAYLVRKDLRTHNANLLTWVQNGGHLIVNYQKTFEWNEGDADPTATGKTNPNFAPYGLKLGGRDRVTYENAPVTLLQPDHLLFHQPNQINAVDWDGWIQERGLYFPRVYDKAYTELFAMNDPNEAPMRGSTLFANYGKGTYLYTALGWYRQLKAYHAGAYKVFANMISLPLLTK